MESNPHIAQEIRRLEEQYAFRPDSLVFGRLADLHRKAGNPRRALEILEEGLRRHPRYLSAHIVRARCLRALDRDEEARQSFLEVLELDGQNLVALRSLAEMALERGAPGEARRHLEALLQVDPRSDEARRMLAEAEAALRRSDGERSREPSAAEASTPAPEETPSPSPAAPEEEVEDLREQVEELDLDEPAEADGEGEMATRTLAGLYETQGFYREAVEMYERLLEERPDGEAEEIRERLERARAALSESGGRSSGASSDEIAVPSPGEGPGEPLPESDPGDVPEPDGAVEDALDEEVEAPSEPMGPAPDARAHLRALLRGDAAGEEPHDPPAERRGHEGAGAHR